MYLVLSAFTSSPISEFISQGFNINAKNLELLFFLVFVHLMLKKSTIFPKLDLFLRSGERVDG